MFKVSLGNLVKLCLKKKKKRIHMIEKYRKRPLCQEKQYRDLWALQGCLESLWPRCLLSLWRLSFSCGCVSASPLSPASIITVSRRIPDHIFSRIPRLPIARRIGLFPKRAVSEQPGGVGLLMFPVYLLPRPSSIFSSLRLEGQPPPRCGIHYICPLFDLL